jgi:PhnB protein
MTQLNAYLSFDGNCTEAMRFYEKTLNGKLEALLTYGQTPACDQMPAADRDRIMHAYLTFDGQVLMAGDAPTGQPYEPMRGFTLTLSYDTVDQARPIFEALAEGGKITMAFQPAFWAEGFGMCIDRFGTPWIVNGSLKPL